MCITWLLISASEWMNISCDSGLSFYSISRSETYCPSPAPDADTAFCLYEIYMNHQFFL